MKLSIAELQDNILSGLRSIARQNHRVSAFFQKSLLVIGFNRCNVLFFLLQLFFCITLSGQDRKPVFQSIQQGLSHQLVKCILKDSKGYVWIGTQDGLNKFDGTNFVIYENDPREPNSISHNMVNALFEDQNHNVWIGTADGLNLYNREKDNFTPIGKLKHIRKNTRIKDLFISSLYADNSGHLWIGTLGFGLIDYEVKTQRVTYYRNNISDNKSIGSDYINCIISDGHGNLWIGTRNGLNYFDSKEKIFAHYVHNPADTSSLSNNFVSSLAVDLKGDLWIGTVEAGLNKLLKNKDIYTFQHYRHTKDHNNLSSDYIYALCTDNKGNLWIGTDNGGLNHLNITTGRICSYRHEEGNPKSISCNTIRTIYTDINDVLWVGTYNRGINLWDKKFEKFTLYQKNLSNSNTLNDNDVTGFTEDIHGKLWIATDDGGISVYDFKKRQFIKSITKENSSLSTNATLAIIHDIHENIWVGTWGGGIDRLNKEGLKVKNYQINGFQKTGDNKISCLYEDKKGNIWAGTLGSGLFLYNVKTDKFIQVYDWEKASRLPNMAFVSVIFEDHEKNLWVGTLNGIINVKRIGEEKFSFLVFYTNNESRNISSNRISTIFEDSRRNIWFGTSDKGLNLFNRRDSSFSNFQKKDGLPNNSINGILEDNKGNLWISTNKGISKFNPLEITFKNYTKEDGLNSNEFYLNSCLKTREGKFCFGGNNGFNTFYPDSIKENTYVPPVYLSDFKIYNKSAQIGVEGSPLKQHISLTNKITLTYKQNSFTIEFVALNFTCPSQNQYAYMLEGKETEWNYVGHKRSASYTFINPGTYVFKVKGSNNDNVWNEIPTTLEIKILPPFWKTIWAYILYIVIIVSILYGFLKLLMIRAKQSHILELNKMKLEFFANLSHELRTPLSLILSPLENIISTYPSKKDLKSQLLMINRNANRLYRLVNELMDFNKVEDNNLRVVVQSGNIVKFIREVSEFYRDEALKKQINYEFIADNERIEAWFDTDKLEKIILNLLSNAFKFTNEHGKIAIKVEKMADNSINTKNINGSNKEFVKISIIDNGLGIPQQYLDKVFDRFFQVHDENDKLPLSGTGIGLSLTKSLVELHHGNIFVTSEKWKETCFSVILPLGNKHFAKEEILTIPVDVISDNAKPVLINKPGDVKNGTAREDAPIILVVEDNNELRAYIVSQLSDTYNILEASNGEMGFKLATEHVPELIISDIIMPRMTGIELCKKIKEDITTSHIPFILLTAKITLEDKIEGIQTGADAYITKPFNIRHIEVTIKNLIDTRHKLFQRFSQEAYMMPKEISNNELDQKFLEKIIGYIEANITNDELTVENLAHHLLMSRGHIWRKIKSLTGQTATEFIRTIRLKKSIKLIEAGELNISEIAFKVGFASPAYYTKCFKAQFGTSPTEFLSNNPGKKKQ